MPSPRTWSFHLYQEFPISFEELEINNNESIGYEICTLALPEGLRHSAQWWQMNLWCGPDQCSNTVLGEQGRRDGPGRPHPQALPHLGQPHHPFMAVSGTHHPPVCNNSAEDRSGPKAMHNLTITNPPTAVISPLIPPSSPLLAFIQVTCMSEMVSVHSGNDEKDCHYVIISFYCVVWGHDRSPNRT
ncbi:hypothetical protein E2C01_027868 [Portunus trituberculatus]|uniref:Uncharacterized protein n=1 Tax=Portunus trituberculatus TaxID=210409 RepID=A0A5B7EMC3_PORTR|nr:hypothetical protein [Portunus trituberculatus]